MRLLFDTCVLYPTVMREMLMGVCTVMSWTPQWSERILEEWRRATIKLGPEGHIQAESEIALLRASWPKACVTWPPSLEARLFLPDEADRHVLAAAISGSSDLIVTVNAKDFPRHTLREEGVDRIAPDELIHGALLQNFDQVAQVANDLSETASQMSGEVWTPSRLLKKARLTKTAKALRT